MSNKPKTLFDHLKAITQYQTENYFETLTDTDKKTWNTFMILRYLSMNSEWIEIVNDLQPITIGIQLKPELVYKMLIGIIPKSNTYLQYIKSKSEGKFEKDLVQIIMNHYNVSQIEAIDYLQILFSNEDDKKEVIEILKMYGYDDKEIKKLIKIKE